jgi:hypothetical protein
MLRRLQEDVNLHIEDLQRALQGQTALPEERRRDAERLAERQGRLRDLWLRLAERFGLPTEETAPAPDDGDPR